MASCSGGCGSTSGNAEMCITRGATYRRSVLYKRYADGVQVPLDASDYTAELIVRRSLDYPTTELELSEGAGLTLVTEDDAVRIYIEVDASVTALLAIGSGWRYTLVLSSLADPDGDTVVLLNSTAKVVDTAA